MMVYRIKKIIIFIEVLAFFFFLDIGCIIKLLTGIPCPGCGITRAILLGLQGEIGFALQFHPLFPLTIFLLIIWLFREGEIFSNSKYDNIAWLFIGGLYLGVYIIRMKMLFPSIPPMDYNENSLLSQVWSFINYAY